MKKFAFVNQDTGDCVQILEVGLAGSEYTDGMILNDFLLLDVTDRDDLDILRSERFYKNNMWLPRPAPPSLYYDWNPLSEFWMFNKDRLFSEVRAIRDSKLAKCDWTAMPDTLLSEDAIKAQWLIYRQELRDITETFSDITSLEDIVWPTSPA